MEEKKLYESRIKISFEIPMAVISTDPGKAAEKLDKYASVWMKRQAFTPANVEMKFVTEPEREIPQNLSTEHYKLIECGYPIEMIKDWTEEQCEAELSYAAEG